jgi:hypothetical protein
MRWCTQQAESPGKKLAPSTGQVEVAIKRCKSLPLDEYCTVASTTQTCCAALTVPCLIMAQAYYCKAWIETETQHGLEEGKPKVMQPTNAQNQPSISRQR